MGLDLKLIGRVHGLKFLEEQGMSISNCRKENTAFNCLVSQPAPHGLRENRALPGSRPMGKKKEIHGILSP